MPKRRWRTFREYFMPFYILVSVSVMQGYAHSRNDITSITTAAQWRALIDDVNSGKNFKDKKVVLANDVFLNDTTGWKDWERGGVDIQPWQAVGSLENPFSGTFDGQGFTVYGLYADGSRNNDLQGLFGVVKHATIKNVSVKASIIRGDQYLGGVVALSISQGKDDINRIVNCHFQGTIIGRGNYIGGILGAVVSQGDSCTRISGCSNVGTMEGMNYVGGIVGMYNNNMGKHQPSIVSGLVAGREKIPVNLQPDEKKVPKRPSGSFISRCYNRGEIRGSMFVGGIIGGYEALIWSWQTVPDTLIHCYNTGTIEANTAGGAIAGRIRRSQSWRWADFDSTYIFSNCYHAGTVNTRFAQQEQLLIGDIWMVYDGSLTDRSFPRCYSLIPTVQQATNRRGTYGVGVYMGLPDAYVAGVSEADMQSPEFVDRLNEGAGQPVVPTKVWATDTEKVNKGFPILIDNDQDL